MGWGGNQRPFLLKEFMETFFHIYLFLAVLGLHCGPQDLHFGMWDLSLQFVRLSSCGPQAHGLCSCSSRALQLWHWGLVALAMWDLRSLTMYGACISCTGRWILNHWKSPPWRFRLILPESVLPEKQEAIKQEIYREMFNIKINLVIPQYKIKRLKKKKKKDKLVTSLVVHWLRLHTPNARDPGSIPGHGTKIPYATASKDPLCCN